MTTKQRIAYGLTMVVSSVTRRLAIWVILSLSIVAAGFACDGVTETGHHLLLIIGGIVIGAGAATELK